MKRPIKTVNEAFAQKQNEIADQIDRRNALLAKISNA
jgi:hypothetical protein